MLFAPTLLVERDASVVLRSAEEAR
jgi:hypothetical protein